MSKILLLACLIVALSHAQIFRLNPEDKCGGNGKFNFINPQLSYIHQIISPPKQPLPSIPRTSEPKLCSCGHHYVKDQDDSKHGFFPSPLLKQRPHQDDYFNRDRRGRDEDHSEDQQHRRWNEQQERRNRQRNQQKRREQQERQRHQRQQQQRRREQQEHRRDQQRRGRVCQNKQGCQCKYHRQQRQQRQQRQEEKYRINFPGNPLLVKQDGKACDRCKGGVCQCSNCRCDHSHI